MTGRWLWVLAALLGAQLIGAPKKLPRHPTHARELKRAPTQRPGQD